MLLATTTITARRPPPSLQRDGRDKPPPPVVVASGIKAHIGSHGGRTDRDGASSGRQATDARLGCDPCALQHGDEIIDDVTGETYRLEWVELRQGLGLDHLEGGLNRTTGVAP